MKNARANRAKLLFFIIKYVIFWRSCCRPRGTKWIVYENVIYQALFAAILVGYVIREKKNILEYDKYKKPLVILTMVLNEI